MEGTCNPKADKGKEKSRSFKRGGKRLCGALEELRRKRGGRQRPEATKPEKKKTNWKSHTKKEPHNQKIIKRGKKKRGPN